MEPGGLHRKRDRIVVRSLWSWCLAGVLLAGVSACSSAPCTSEADLGSPACALAIHEVTPDQAGITSRVQITVTGENFHPGTRVFIGGLALVRPTIESPNRITGTLSAGTAVGDLDVVVTRGQQQVTLTNGFTGLDELTLRGVFPQGYAPGTLDVVTLYGTGFQPGMKVWFGDHEVAPRVLDAGTLEFLMPPNATVGIVDLRVQREEEEAQLGEAFTVGGWMPDRSRRGTVTDLQWTGSQSALAIGSGGVLFHSGDAGANWREIRPNEELCPAYEVRTSSLGTLLATSCGIFVSGNGGESWRRLGSGIQTVSLVAEPRTSHLFALIDQSLHHSTDGGVTWTRFEGWSGTARNLIVLSSGAGWTPFLGRAEGLFRARDGHRSPVLPGFIRLAVQSPLHPSVAYVVVDTTLYRTRDGGETWEQGGGPGLLAWDDLRFDSSGCAWALGMGMNIQWMLYRSCDPEAASPRWELQPAPRAGRMVAVSADGSLLSSNGTSIERMVPGGVFEDIGAGLPFIPGRGWAAEAGPPGRIVTTVGDSALMSRDDGRSWSALATCDALAPLSEAMIEPPGAGWSPRIFGEATGHLIIGEDFGTACRSVPLPAQARDVVVVTSGADRERLFLLSRDDEGRQQQLHVTTDEGQTWTYLGELGIQSFWMMQPISLRGEPWLCGQRGLPHSWGAVVCMREDGTDPVEISLNARQMRVQPMPDGEDRLWLVAEDRLRVSTLPIDSGAFTEIPLPGHVQQVQVHGDEVLAVVRVWEEPPAISSWLELYATTRLDSPWRRLGRMPDTWHGELVLSPASRTLWWKTTQGLYRAGPAIRP